MDMIIIPPKMDIIIPPKMLGHVKKYPNYYLYTFVLFGVFDHRGITEVRIDGRNLVVTLEVGEKCSWRFPLPEDAIADGISARFRPEKLFVKVHKRPRFIPDPELARVWNLDNREAAAVLRFLYPGLSIEEIRAQL